jgi:hypothetical protein
MRKIILPDSSGFYIPKRSVHFFDCKHGVVRELANPWAGF